MSSNTSAFLSSQTEISQGITAGVWVVPELDECGEIIETEEGLTINEEDLILGEENIGSCEDNDEINEEKPNDVIDEAICVNEDEAILSETDLIDCVNLEMDSKVDEDEDEIEGEEEQVIKDTEKEDEPIKENDGLEEEKEIETEIEKDMAESTEKLQEKPKEEIQKQPGDKGEPIIEQVDMNPVIVDDSIISNSDEETDD